MSLAFRPRVGPFIYIPNTGPGLFSKFIALLLCLGLIWPLQLTWLLIKYAVIGCVYLVQRIRWEMERRRA